MFVFFLFSAIFSASSGLGWSVSNRGDEVGVCHFDEIDFWLKKQIFNLGCTEPPFRANLLFGMLKVVLSEPPFRDRPYCF